MTKRDKITLIKIEIMITPWQHIDPDIRTRSSNSTGTFPEIWKEEYQPIVDKYVMQKLNKLEQEVKALKEELERLRL